MKKLLLVGALALFGAMNAQTKFGLKAGYSLSTITEKYKNEKEKNDGKSSFYVGGLVEYKLNSKWALQGELLYSELGAKNEQEVTVLDNNDQLMNVNSKIDIRLSAIMIPIGAKYFIDPNVSINGGFAFVFYFDRNIDVDVEGIGGSPITANGVVKTFNLAPYLGLEYNLNNGLFFDTRYNFGINNISQIKLDGYKMNNSFFQIGLGYKF